MRFRATFFSAAALLGAAALSLNLLIPSVARAADGVTDIATLTLACVACHGQNGAATLPGAPNLAGQNARYALRQLELIKSGERPAPLMAGQLNHLSSDDLKRLAEHYAAMPPIRGVAQDTALELGESIYRGGIADKGVSACSACHAPSGGGNPPAGYPQISGQPVDYVAAQLLAYREGQRSTDDEFGGMMRGVAANLNDREIAALANYVLGLH